MGVLEKLKDRLQVGFPHGIVNLRTEDEVHFSLILTDQSFKGMSKIEQHRKVYAVIGDMMVAECHALQIETLEG